MPARKNIMKVIVTGASGQLGTDVMKELISLGYEAIPADLPTLDITDKEKTVSFITKNKPDAVIHCAAFTAVDLAETEREKCRLINVDGTENVAYACTLCGAKLLYLSTDYVFGGKGDAPYETDSEISPCNYYGKTKYLGEEAVRKNEKHFIVRISWVFGKSGKNFVKAMLHLSQEREEISVVNDQIGSPTYTPDLARLLCKMLTGEKYGTYHATNEGYCSWAEFAEKIMELSGSKTKIVPISSAEYESAAVRPNNSRMSKVSLDENGFDRLPSWQNALERYFE